MKMRSEARSGRLMVNGAWWSVFVLALVLAGAALGQEGGWVSWSSESHSLEARESFQFRVKFEEIPVRSWRLVVDGGDVRCDLNVVRRRGDALLYAQNDESHHDVEIPWGKGEEVIVVVTARNDPGAFVVTVYGPPEDQTHGAYSYDVNRALELYAGGQRLEAETACRDALRKDPDDGVAKVLLAGFLRHRRDYDGAAKLVDEALENELNPEMKTLAMDLRAELRILRAPLPEPLRIGIEEAESHLHHGRPEQTLAIADKLLGGELELDATAKSRLHLLRGRALAGVDRNFEALDAYTTAMHLNRARTGEAVIYFYMGRLYYGMDNLAQAQGAYTFALQHGLPGSLAELAREDLQVIERRLRADR
ncbi:MAG: hypothetical protein GY838_07600 [bacterium]|nr:hypothetical protein [bacterium]